MGSWRDLVQSFPSLLVQYTEHCVSQQSWDLMGGFDKKKEVRRGRVLIWCGVLQGTAMGVFGSVRWDKGQGLGIFVCVSIKLG